MEERLIEFVRKNRFIYDKNHEWHNNINYRKQKFQELSAELHVPARTLKDRWRTLRDKYLREKKRELSETDDNKPKWKFYHQLQFLSNVDDESLFLDIPQPKIPPKIPPLSPPTTAQTRKRKLRQPKSEEGLVNAEIELPEIKKFAKQNLKAPPESPPETPPTVQPKKMNLRQSKPVDAKNEPSELSHFAAQSISTPTLTSAPTSSTPKKSSMQQFFDMMATQVEELQLDTMECVQLQIELQKSLVTFVQNKRENQ